MKNFCIAIRDKIKNYKVKIFIVFIVYLLFSAMINYIVNPYNIFPLQKNSLLKIKPTAKKHLAVSKIISFKLDSRKIDTIFIGSQKTDFSIRTNIYKMLTKSEAFNIASSGYSLEDYPAVLQSVINIHPEISTVFAELSFSDFNEMNKNPKNKRFNVIKNGYLTLSELYTAFFSLSGIKDSFYTIWVNITGQKAGMFDSDGIKMFFPDKNVKQTMENSVAENTQIYESFHYKKNSIEIIKNLQKICDENKKELYIYIMPTHLMNMQLMKKQELYDTYFAWKKEISKLIPIYDFEYPCSITNEAISPNMKYFSGIVTPTVLTGNFVLMSMQSGKIEFGRIYTDDYAEIFNNSDRSELGMLTVDEENRNEFLEKSVQKAVDTEENSQ